MYYSEVSLNGATQKIHQKIREYPNSLLLSNLYAIHSSHINLNHFRQAAYDRMLGQLAQCEYTMRKSHFCRRMIDDELENYKRISKAIDGGIEQAKIQIDQSKESLTVAKKIRKNKMEYDVLAKIIKQQPDRKETLTKLDALKKELEDLKESLRRLDGKLEGRRNDFTVLMRSIHELQKKLDIGGDEDNESNKLEYDNDVNMLMDGEILDDSK